MGAGIIRARDGEIDALALCGGTEGEGELLGPDGAGEPEDDGLREADPDATDGEILPDGDALALGDCEALGLCEAEGDPAEGEALALADELGELLADGETLALEETEALGEVLAEGEADAL